MFNSDSLPYRHQQQGVVFFCAVKAPVASLWWGFFGDWTPLRFRLLICTDKSLYRWAHAPRSNVIFSCASSVPPFCKAFRCPCRFCLASLSYPYNYSRQASADILLWTFIFHDLTWMPFLLLSFCVCSTFSPCLCFSLANYPFFLPRTRTFRLTSDIHKGEMI